jgi:galactofuranose transport system substrate-binding protein
MRSLYTALFLTAAVVACKKSDNDASGKAGASDKARTVGFAQVGAESAWRTAETESIRAEATNRKVNLKFSDAQGKQENQITAVRGFIAQGVDAIILAPVVETGWEPVLLEAKQAKIPVVLVDRGIKTTDDTLYTTLIASDFVAEGKMAAEWLAKKTGGKAGIVELKAFPDLKIIASQSGDFRRSNGKEVMEALLKKHGKEITAVYGHNDDMALGAIQAIEESGAKPGTDVIVVSVDGVKDAFTAMVDGKLNASVECNPLLGPLAFDAVEKALKGETLPKRTVVQDRLFDTTTAKDVIATRKY